MGKLYRVSRALRQWGSRVADLDAVLSLDPRRMFRRLVNKEVAKQVDRQVTNRLILRKRKK